MSELPLGDKRQSTYWLIERGSPAEWWAGTQGPSHTEWTRDVNKVHPLLKFETREQAQGEADRIKYWDAVGGAELRVTEHMDCDGPALVSAKRECETCKGDPAVCATVPGLRHCEAAMREEETPRTDQAVTDNWDDGVPTDWVPASFARQLERELAERTEELDVTYRRYKAAVAQSTPSSVAMPVASRYRLTTTTGEFADWAYSDDPARGEPLYASPPTTLSEFVHASPETREAIGEEVAERAIERQCETRPSTGAHTDLIERLRKRAEIRRQIPGRKSVQEGQPDRIADLLDEAAKALSSLPPTIREPEGYPGMAHDFEVLWAALEQIVRDIPACADGRLYVEHFDEHGNTVGVEDVDPLAVIGNINGIAQRALKNAAPQVVESRTACTVTASAAKPDGAAPSTLAEQAIQEHNSGCLAACGKTSPYEHVRASRRCDERRDCPDCPKDWMIEWPSTPSAIERSGK